MKTITLMLVLWSAAADLRAAIFNRYEIQQEQPVATSEAHLERRLRSRGAAAWKIPLGTAQIEELRWLSDQTLYVALRLDSAALENLDHFVVDAASGAVLWREARPEEDRYRLIYAGADVLLFLVDDRRQRRSLLAMSATSGSELWQARQEKTRGGDYVSPTVVPDLDLVLAVNARQGRAEALRLSTGTRVWERKLARQAGAIQPLLTDGLRLWDPNGHLQRVDPDAGTDLWTETGVTVDANLQPEFHAEEMIVAQQGQLLVVEAESGRVRSRIALPDGLQPTNVLTEDDRIFLRGYRAGSATSTTHVLSAIDLGSGALLWSHETPAPSLSNVIVEENALFHASATTVYKLDAATGQSLFAATVTDTGRSFPVRLRRTDEHVVYIGELVVAGIDANTGSTAFRHGMTPISPETSLNALDYSIPQLRAQMGESSASGVSFTASETQRYQNMANSYSRQAQSFRTQAFMARSSGNSSMADSARLRSLEAQSAANRASQQARTAATVEMSLAVMNLAIQMQEMWKQAGIKSRLDRQLLFRQSILTSYAAAEDAMYVFRPHTRYRSADDHFAGIKVVHLPTGRDRFVYLSAAYGSYGLWNLLDLDRSRVIHHGVGLDPVDFTYGEARRFAPLAPRIRHVESYLMAVPLDLP